MTYSRCEVVALSFPFLEGTDAKRRPALTVSTKRLRREQGLYWIAMITTAKSGCPRDNIAVTNREHAGPPEECVIRVARLAAIGDAQIARRLGEIVPKDRNAVLSLLRRYIA